ncbi:hypothetical protein C0989_007653 [Termitomyces sp. Mn162]|nr:hypothetical protein C0989_007653 [Termitomyces sp. Mn162]
MVKHLSPAIKHLLTLRNPNVLPSPPVAKLNALFARTSQDAKLKNAETGWLVLATCALLTANRPASIGHLYRFVTRPNMNEPNSRVNVAHAVNKAALMRESALKTFIIQSYGTVLSPLPGGTRAFHDESGLIDSDQGNLSRALGSVVGIATLRAEGRVGPQLTSHTFGLLKARYLEGLSAEDAWLSSDEGTEWVLRTVDEILDVISSEDQEVEVEVKL